MPRLEPEKQENGSLTGVKTAGEGSQAVTAEDSAVGVGAVMDTSAFGEGAFNASRPDAALGTDSFGDIWGQIQGKTSFDTNVKGGEKSFSTTVTGGGGGGNAGAGGKGNSGLVDYAKRFLGTPYVWGGTSPSGFDCSGFTQYVMKQFGINLPRISYQQGAGGQSVDRGNIKAGDLVFWDLNSRNAGADHVGIYIGGGKYIHAPQPGSSVKISSLGGNYWARRWGGGRSGSGGGNTRQRAV
jgi:cell wall-associated NlpC family hydrolase